MPRPGRFNLRKESRCPLYNGWVDFGAGPDGCVKYCPPWGLESRTFQAVSSGYTDCNIGGAKCLYSWEVLLSFVWNPGRKSLLLHGRETRFRIPSHRANILFGHFPCHLSRSRRHERANRHLNINSQTRSPSQLQPTEQCVQGCFQSYTYIVVSRHFLVTGIP